LFGRRESSRLKFGVASDLDPLVFSAGLTERRPDPRGTSWPESGHRPRLWHERGCSGWHAGVRPSRNWHPRNGKTPGPEYCGVEARKLGAGAGRRRLHGGRGEACRFRADRVGRTVRARGAFRGAERVLVHGAPGGQSGTMGDASSRREFACGRHRTPDALPRPSERERLDFGPMEFGRPLRNDALEDVGRSRPGVRT